MIQFLPCEAKLPQKAITIQAIRIICATIMYIINV